MADTINRQTVSGDHNIFTATGDLHVVYNLPSAETETCRNLWILLDRVKHFWIEGVLENSLFNQVLIEVGKESRPESIEHPWERVLALPNSVRRPIPPEKEIREIFLEMGRALLILGEPGSGKTITLLELARGLILSAQNDPTQPIPVVFNLSTWTEHHHSMLIWFVDELSEKYQIPKTFGHDWLANQRIVLLLDGLDEVRADLRTQCVEAINEFGASYGVPGLVVCSRLKEYQNLSVHLRLNGAVCLQALKEGQIKAYCETAGPKLASLSNALQEDPSLLELARSPLMLSILSLSYQEQPESIRTRKANKVYKHAGTHRALSLYVNSMFNRKGRRAAPFARNGVIASLSWLANKMIENNQSMFLIEGLQPGWLETPSRLSIYFLLSRLVEGSILGLIVGSLITLPRSVDSFWGPEISLMVSDWITGILSGTVVGIVFGIAGGLRSAFMQRRHFDNLRSAYLFLLFVSTSCALIVGYVVDWGFGMSASLLFFLLYGWRTANVRLSVDIQAREQITWTWGGALKGGVAGFSLGLIFSLVVFLIYRPDDYDEFRIASQLGYFISLMPIWLITGAMIGGLRGGIEEKRTFPNEGIRIAARNASVYGATAFSLTTAVFFLFCQQFLEFDLKSSLAIGFNAGISVGLVTFLWCGGIDVIRHVILRLILGLRDVVTFKYSRFLDFATEIGFLQQVGGGYIFIHRLLLEHFAAMRRGDHQPNA